MELTLESTFDVIVVGLGAMGSAAAYQLSKRGAKVLGLEAFTPAHDKGSSHGESRIIRQAYYEDPAYVPLVLSAYELWDQLQEESNEDLLTITGGVAIGPTKGALVTGCLRSAKQYGLGHDLFDAKEMRRRFPQFALTDDEVGFYEEKAGYLKPEECIRQHLRGASKRGADLRFEEPVLSWTASREGDGVTVTTAKQTYHARSLVISVGPWFGELAPDVSMPVVVSRRVMFWLKPLRESSSFDREVFPIFLWAPEGSPLFYGLPRISEDGSPKVGIHSGNETCTPSTIDRRIHPRDESAMRSAIGTRIPSLNGGISHAATCMYTMTPDEHFIIDTHPNYPQVSLAGGFSGHGFKFSSVVGEILCDLAMTRETSTDIRIFSGSRFRQRE
ncbi:N-methyl-L-tryptophan oxidase [Tunturiibacter psychrotolerans]|uniref:N-methyl-L-tryptophan oxidase n=1 Tax=Tunturiibacter psychrotolerans TaxID=3069686 RepID=UPI003D9B6274